MVRTDEYLGLCPLCYKPINASENHRIIRTREKQEIYHTLCIHGWSIRNAPTGSTGIGVGMTILEEHNTLMIGTPHSNRAEWMAERRFQWQASGVIHKERREKWGFSLNKVAKHFGISPARLKRFEEGKPVRDAKLISQCYMIFIYSMELANEHRDLLKSLYEYGEQAQAESEVETHEHS